MVARKTRRVRSQRGGTTPYQTQPRTESGEINGFSWAGALHGGYGEWKKNFMLQYVLAAYTEDRFAVAPLGSTGLAAIVLDGHGGARVAVLAKELLPRILQENISESIFDDVSALQKAVTKSFADCAAEMFRKEGYGLLDVGSACTVAIITPKYVVMGNIGDCVGLVTKRDASEFITTVDHDCENPEEVTRLNSIYAKIKRGSPPCRDTGTDAGIRLMGQLAMTKAFGDLKYDPYISTVPSLYVASRQPNQRVILTSDSFTEGIAPSRVHRGQNAIKNILTREQVLEELTPQLNAEGTLETKVSNAVTTRVNKLWFDGYGYSGDNTALLVVELPDPPQMKIGSETNVENISGFFEPKEGGKRRYRRTQRNRKQRKH